MLVAYCPPYRSPNLVWIAVGRAGKSLRSGLFPRFEPSTRVSKTPFSKQNTWKIPRLRPNLTHSRLREGYSIKLAKRCHASDFTARLVAFTHRNRRQAEMEVAVTAVLAVQQLTARDVFGD